MNTKEQCLKIVSMMRWNVCAVVKAKGHEAELKKTKEGVYSHF
jgi:hypothetical protein